MRPTLLYSIIWSLVAFLLTPKYMTLSDLDWLFRAKFCFRAGLAGSHRATSGNNCVKTNEDRHTLSAVQIFDRDSSFWQYKVCADIRSGSLERSLQTTLSSRVMRTFYRRILAVIIGRRILR